MSVLYVFEAAKPQPAAQMVYAEGDYAHAVQCHQAAQAWAKENGAWNKDGLRAFINRPHHPESPASSRIAPVDLMDEPKWSITVDFYCDSDTLEWLLKLPLPPVAQWFVPITEGLLLRA